MNRTDRQLGMDRNISRRDFLNGVAVTVGASLLPISANAQNASAQDLPEYYPPSLTGLRGAHPGSFEAAHQARDGQTFEGIDTGERYDLIVVGGGISGLSAAYFFQQRVGSNAKILILDNHDDFGGHAKRNEFEVDGQTLIGYGGTAWIEAPAGYPAVAKKLITDLGIETKRFYKYFDQELFASHGLADGYFFDKETFGADHLAVGSLADPSVLDDSPLSAKAREDLVRLHKDERHYLPDMPAEERDAYLNSMDYITYLRDRAGMGDDALKIMQPAARTDWAVNSDAFPAHAAWWSGYPGFGDLGSESSDGDGGEEEPLIFHFPDGNASIARMLVRNLIPEVADGDSMEDIVTERFRYNQLDNAKSNVRIRLNSTVVRAQHNGNKLTEPVSVTYVRDGKAHAVEGAKVVMACYNAILPRLCPEMPVTQKTALSNAVRAPLNFTNILVRNWTSFKKLGVSQIHCPGGYFYRIGLDMPVSMGDYQFSSSPDQPIVIRARRVPGMPGASAHDQFKAGQYDMLSTPFETYERNIRDQLARTLGPGGFDPAQDILGITVNRWPHGYAYGYDPESDDIAFWPSTWPEQKRHWVTGRQPFGNISIASIDSASNAMTEAAIMQAHRAVNELT